MFIGVCVHEKILTFALGYACWVIGKLHDYAPTPMSMRVVWYDCNYVSNLFSTEYELTQ